MHPDRYCLLGHPVAHSQSPWIQQRFAQLTKQHLIYTVRDVAPGYFAAAVQTLINDGARGCNVTVPFKFEAADLAHHKSQRVLLAQACNCLSFVDGQILADNTDGIGLVYDIEQLAGRPIKGRRVLLLGAGGAASGVLGPLIEAKPRHISIVNRTPERAVQLTKRHLPLARQQQVDLQAQPPLTQHFDIIINATSSSLQNADVPVSRAVLAPGALAYDMMYGAAAKPFLRWAQSFGASARDGLGMLVAQAAQTFWLWRGVLPDAAPVLTELRLLLDQQT